MPSGSEQKEALSQVNAGILIARTLVHARFGQDKARYAGIVDRVRHCKLMAIRVRLAPLQAHRLDLCAWLSAFPDQPEIVAPLAKQHHVEGILAGAAGAADQPATLEADILSLIITCQDLVASGGSTRDLKRLQHDLETRWATTPDRVQLVRRFVNILREEAFLSQVERAMAGRILIVDPEEAVTPVLAPPLMAEGYQVQVARDGDEARQALSTFPADAILSELNLPFADGVEFYRQLRQDPKTARIPFLIVTSTKGKPAARKCLREGIEDVLTKPVDLEILFFKLKRMVAAAASSGAAAQPAAGGVTGSLADMSFVDIVQIITAGGRSMAISLASGDRQGEVVIRGGDVIHAKTGDLQGDQAFYALMGWKEGTFTTRHCVEFPVQTIDTPIMSLLMEGSRQMDEGSGAAG